MSSPDQIQSGISSKRASPPTSVFPAAKRLKNDEVSTSGGATPSSSSGPPVDPDQLSDALLSAGVDLKEEENLLSSTLQAPDSARLDSRNGSISVYPQTKLVVTNLLDTKNLQNIVRKTSTEMGIKHVYDKEQDISTLLSLSCEEWLSDIITDAIVLSRHRRKSRNDVHSNLSRVLRNIAIKDKEREDQANARKAVLQPDSQAAQEDKKNTSEETQYRQANLTASMMTGKKKYSWLTGSGPGNNPNRTDFRADSHIRFREAREEPGIALRDLLGALEEKRFGVEKAIIKGYARFKS